MYCPNCGRNLPDTAVFCDVCGARIQGETPVQPVYETPSYSYEAPAADLVQETKPEKKRSAVLGVFVLLCAVAILITGIVSDFMMVRLYGFPPMFMASNLPGRIFAFAAYLLIAVYLLGSYRKRGKMILAAVGALILLVWTLFSFVMTSVRSHGVAITVPAMISYLLPVICAALLAVHWFLYGRVPALGIIACCLLILTSLLGMVSSFAYPGYGQIHVLIRVISGFFALIMYSLILVAVIISRKDSKN